jgi:hypothetical protein
MTAAWSLHVAFSFAYVFIRIGRVNVDTGTDNERTYSPVSSVIYLCSVTSVTDLRNFGASRFFPHSIRIIYGPG